MKMSRTARVRTLVALAFVGAGVVLAAGAQQPTPARAAAPSLTRPTSPTKAPDADGFLLRWLLLEPIKVPGQLTESAVRSAITLAPGGDTTPGTAVDNAPPALPKDGESVTVNGESLAWHAVDTLGYNVNLFHFAYALEQADVKRPVLGRHVVDAPREMSGVRLAIGSNAASIWWLNGAGSDRASTTIDRRSSMMACRNA